MGRLDFLDDELLRLERAHLLRAPRSHTELPENAIWLCSNDYLGLAGRETEARGPGGAGAAALVWGYGPAHARAEVALARYADVEACLLFSSGYAANVGLVSALAGKGDLIVSDALNHASLIDGSRLSGARTLVVPHLDLDAVREALRAPARRRFFLTESYFSMDGDGPDLAALAAICADANAVLVVDEAHALGVLGPGGRGRCAEAGIVPDVLIGTLGKAFGLAGAFVGGSRALRTWLWNRARSYVFSTAVSPALAEAASLRVSEVEEAHELRARVLRHSERFRQLLEIETGTRPGGFGPIIPLRVGEPEAALSIASQLLSEGWVVQPMRPPTVPVGSSRLRLTVRASLLGSDLERAAVAIGRAVRAHAGGSASAGLPAAEREAVGGIPRPFVVAVVGTGTEVGKTYVGSRLLAQLVARGLRVAGRKPIESGVSGEQGADQAALEVAGSIRPESPAPFRFAQAVSPHLAARHEGREVGLAEARRWATRGGAEVFLVESAGGLLSPLGGGRTNLDLVVELDPQVIVLVGSDRLGVLHDVSACRMALESAGLWRRCVVALSTPPVPDGSTGSNAAELVSLEIAGRVVVWPRGADAAAATWDQVCDVAGRST